MSFNAIRENKILLKICEFTVSVSDQLPFLLVLLVHVKGSEMFGQLTSVLYNELDV